jgi:hypothetical protein
MEEISPMSTSSGGGKGGMSIKSALLAEAGVITLSAASRASFTSESIFMTFSPPSCPSNLRFRSPFPLILKEIELLFSVDVTKCHKKPCIRGTLLIQVKVKTNENEVWRSVLGYRPPMVEFSVLDPIRTLLSQSFSGSDNGLFSSVMPAATWAGSCIYFAARMPMYGKGKHSYLTHSIR